MVLRSPRKLKHQAPFLICSRTISGPTYDLDSPLDGGLIDIQVDDNAWSSKSAERALPLGAAAEVKTGGALCLQ